MFMPGLVFSVGGASPRSGVQVWPEDGILDLRHIVFTTYPSHRIYNLSVLAG